MSVIYFSSTTVGGSNDGDYGNLLNFWQDSGLTIPNAAVPLSTDDVALSDSPLIGTGVCNNLTGTTPWTVSGASITLSGTATNVVFNSGSLLGNSGTLNASACTFTADPGGNISGVSTCSYFASMVHNITDDGTGNFTSSSTFSGNIIYSGNLSTASSCTFTGAVTCSTISCGATFTSTVNSTSISAGNFGSGTITSNLISGGTFTSTPIVLFQNGGDGGGVSLQLTSTSGTYTVSLPSYGYILLISNGGGGSYTVYIPEQTQVATSVTFGTSGSATGSLSGGGGTLGFCG